MDKNVNYPRNGLRLCIDEKAGDLLSGRFYSPMEETERTFRGVEEMLLKADAVFEEHRYPQAFVQKRSFREEEVSHTGYGGVPPMVCPIDLREAKGRLKTYNVIVTSRRNATWQGILQDEAGSRIGSFQGEIELLALLQQPQES